MCMRVASETQILLEQPHLVFLAQQVSRRHSEIPAPMTATRLIPPRFPKVAAESLATLWQLHPVQYPQSVVRDIHFPPPNSLLACVHEFVVIVVPAFPSVIKASTKLLRLSSGVSKRREPQRCAAELMLKVRETAGRSRHESPRQCSQPPLSSSSKLELPVEHVVLVQPAQFRYFPKSRISAGLYFRIRSTEPNDMRPPESAFQRE